MRVQNCGFSVRLNYNLRHLSRMTMLHSRLYRGGFFNFIAFGSGVFFTLALVSVYQDDSVTTLCDLCHEEVRSLTRNFSTGLRRSQEGGQGQRFDQNIVDGLERDGYKSNEPKLLKGQGDWSSYRFHLDPHSGNVEIVPPEAAEKIIFVVTPTYNRPEQFPELTRITQALLHVKHLGHWVIVEDVNQQSSNLEKFVNNFQLKSTLLVSLKPNCSEKVMATTKLVSMWPVGLVTDWGVSSPIVKNGKVIGFYDGWKAGRKFAVDMAGFAVNIRLLHAKPHANMPWVVGYEEDRFLKSLGIGFLDIQPLAKNCTEILVWHTKAVKHKWARTSPAVLKQPTNKDSNLQKLLVKLPRQNSPSSSGNLRQHCDDKDFSLMKFIFGS